MNRLLLLAIICCLSSCEPCCAGYTIFTNPQVTPEYIVVPGAAGPETVKNRGTPAPYPAGCRLLYSPATFSVYADGDADRTVLLLDDYGTATDAQILGMFSKLKTKIINDIKDIRAQALETATKNSGVYAVYDENYQAALAMEAGSGDVTIMKGGRTATAYLAGFGARLGMSAAQFAAYIVAENLRMGPASYQVEEEYLRLVYGVIPVETSVSKLLAYPADFRRFCGLWAI